MRPAVARAAGVAALCAAVGATAPSADDLMYYVEGDTVVFTNTPSRTDVRPVPGLEERVAAASGHLPATPWDRYIEQLGRSYGVEPDLIKAVAVVESGLDPSAVSPKGAMGLMQLMPATAEAYGVSDPFDPHDSLDGGARHLRDLLDQFGGNRTLALAAYNAGAGAVRRHGGVPAYRETRDYVRKVQTRMGREVRTPPPAATAAEAIVVEVDPDGTVRLSN